MCVSLQVGHQVPDALVGEDEVHGYSARGGPHHPAPGHEVLARLVPEEVRADVSAPGIGLACDEEHAAGADVHDVSGHGRLVALGLVDDFEVERVAARSPLVGEDTFELNGPHLFGRTLAQGAWRRVRSRAAQRRLHHPPRTVAM